MSTTRRWPTSCNSCSSRRHRSSCPRWACRTSNPRRVAGVEGLGEPVELDRPSGASAAACARTACPGRTGSSRSRCGSARIVTRAASESQGRSSQCQETEWEACRHGDLARAPARTVPAFWRLETGPASVAGGALGQGLGVPPRCPSPWAPRQVCGHSRGGSPRPYRIFSDRRSSSAPAGNARSRAEPRARLLPSPGRSGARRRARSTRASSR